PAAGDRERPGQTAQQRRPARPVTAHHRADPAGHRAEGDVVERQPVSVSDARLLGPPPVLYSGGGAGPVSRRWRGHRPSPALPDPAWSAGPAGPAGSPWPAAARTAGPPLVSAPARLSPTAPLSGPPPASCMARPASTAAGCSAAGARPRPWRGAAGARKERNRRLARVNTISPSRARKTKGCHRGPIGSARSITPRDISLK